MRYLSNMIKRLKRRVADELLNAKRVRSSGMMSYSQCGEDLIVRYIFVLRGVAKPSYMDIGAHHPFALSNTAFFYKQGCTGVNIEANPDLFRYFKRHRDKDININVGVGAVESTMDFYVMEDATLSTFSKAEADSMVAEGKKLVKTVPIEVKSIQNILKEYCHGVFPDFLSIDVEGLDFEIIKSINFSASVPKVICVEAAEYSPRGDGARRNDLIDFIASKGYLEYANTNLNAIMVNRAFWNG